MSYAEGKQISTVQSQLQDQRILLIRNISKYPKLYINEFLRTPFLHRNEKQQMWDKIAQESGFEKTEDAKCKWRSIINYLRQHLDHVALKKIRRYIPVSDNPEDKYIQLTDYSLYSELEFVVPYVKYAANKQFSKAGNFLKMSPAEIDLIIDRIETEISTRNDQDKKLTSENNTKPLKEDVQDVKNEKLEIKNDAEDLTEEDKILKEYFENMLKTAFKLPRFHQNRIKLHLMDCINEQKALNKIN